MNNKHTREYWHNGERHLTFNGFCYIDSNGGMRLTRGPSATKKNERRFKLQVNVPKKVFDEHDNMIVVNFPDAGLDQIATSVSVADVMSHLEPLPVHVEVVQRDFSGDDDG